MLKFLVALLFAAVVSGAYVEVDNSGHQFRISLNAASEVRWTKDGLNYRHLQELARFCTVPGTPVALGGIGNWQCEPYDTLKNLNCTGFGGLFNPVVKEVNGVFQCAQEEDTLAYLNATCTDGQTVKFLNGVWRCALDADTFRDLSVTCPSGSTLQWNGTAFTCATGSIFQDSDILGAITCTEGQLVRFNSATNTFSCDSDLDTSPSGCQNGQLIVYDGTNWVCRVDGDFLSSPGIPGCSPATPFLKYRNGAWTCVADYFVLNVIGTPGFLTYIQSANIFQQTGGRTPITSYDVLWGSVAQPSLFSRAAPVFPFNGTITSTYITFNNFIATTDTQITVDFKVNGALVSNNIVIAVTGSPNTQTFNYLSQVFQGQSFLPGQGVSIGFRVTSGALTTSDTLLSSIYVAVYISVTI